jgi:hypothetical protein
MLSAFVTWQFASDRQLARISMWYWVPRCFMTSGTYPVEGNTPGGERV